MAQKKGLVLNEFDGCSIVDALTDAFDIQREKEEQPYLFVESSRSLVMREGTDERREELREVEDDAISMLRKLVE
ncbi:hypothetical protein [Anaerosporobacter faecicola]|uniref:hypothetical protein n=1 Tax=Anaerosporobacter faecicola TaxID=2718714 RepID=UPI00143B6612|nr:hypothetical protein [Anaerosporobacter faecicola]